MLAPGQIWFVKDANCTDPLLTRVEITSVNGNVVGFGDAYYDVRLLDFVGRDYEQEEKRAQERFLETYLPEPEPPYVFEDVEQVESTPTKPSWWTRLKIWWIAHDYHY